MSENEFNHELFSLERQIGEELHLLEKNMDTLSDEDFGSRDIFQEYQQRFHFIHALFDRASDYIRDLVLDQSNPELYALLECKQNIDQHYGLYRYLQNRFTRQFRRDLQGQEDELERSLEPDPAIEKEEELEEEPLPPQEPDQSELEAALLAAEEEAALLEEEKAKKRKAERKKRQEAFTKKDNDVGERRQDFDAPQRGREPGAVPPGAMSAVLSQQGSDQQLQAEQKRMETQRLQEESASRERRVLEEYRRRDELEQAETQHREHYHKADTETQKEHIRQEERRLQDERATQQRQEYYRQALEENRRAESNDRNIPHQEQFRSSPSAAEVPPTPDRSDRYHQKPDSLDTRPDQSAFHVPDQAPYPFQAQPTELNKTPDASRTYDQPPVTREPHRPEQSSAYPSHQAPFRSPDRPAEQYRAPDSAHTYDQPPAPQEPRRPEQGSAYYPHQESFRSPDRPAEQYRAPDATRAYDHPPAHQEQRRPEQSHAHSPKQESFRPAERPAEQHKAPEASRSKEQSQTYHQPHSTDHAYPGPVNHRDHAQTQGGAPNPWSSMPTAGMPGSQPDAPHPSSPSAPVQDPGKAPVDRSGDRPQKLPYPESRLENDQLARERDTRSRYEAKHHAAYHSSHSPGHQTHAYPSGNSYDDIKKNAGSFNGQPSQNEARRFSDPVKQAPQAPASQPVKPASNTQKQESGTPLNKYPSNREEGFSHQPHHAQQGNTPDRGQRNHPQESLRHQTDSQESKGGAPNHGFQSKSKGPDSGPSPYTSDAARRSPQDPRFQSRDPEATRAKDPTQQRRGPAPQPKDSKPRPKDPENTRTQDPKPQHKDPQPDPSGKHEPHQFYHFVPGGIAQTQLRKQAIASLNREHAASSSDNNRIYTTIKASASNSGKPQPISPAYVTQMKFNVDRARIAYQDARGTQDAKQAAHVYLSQRNAYIKLRSDINQGSIQVERPKVMTTKAATRQEKAAVQSTMLYQFIPGGVQGQLLENAQLTGTQYELRNHAGKRTAFRYTRSNPLVVNPAYETALKTRAERASQAMNRAVAFSSARGKTLRVNPALNDEVKVATTAYVGFLRAKQSGQVVVSNDSKQCNPDYTIWSQRYQQSRKSGPRPEQINGSTGQSKGPNPNKVTKESVEEATANILGKSVKLKRQSAVSHFMKNAGYRIEGYTSMALSRASRKFYYMMQNGDEDAPESLRTFERGRYYLTTTVGIAGAIKNFHVVNASGASRAGAKQERHRYSKYFYQDKKELSRQIHHGIKNNRLLKSEIKELMKQGSSLSPEQRKELLSKIKALAQSSRETTKAVGYRDLQRKNRDKIKASKDLESKRKVITTRKKADEAIQKIRQTQEKKMAKKFGNLTIVTDKSLARQIQQMTTQGRELKQQIKLLQSKGSLLTANERKQLMKLIKKHQALSAELRRYTGLRDARKNLKAMLAPYMDMRKAIMKNANAWANGGYALYGFITNGLRQSGDIGVLGLAKAADIATNRYVRIVVKKAFSLSFNTAKWISKKTGLEKAAKKATHATVNAIAKTAPVQTIGNGLTATKATIKTAVNTSKRAAVRMTPKFVKTGVAKGAKGKALVKEFAKRTQKKFAESAIGRGLSAVYRNVSKFASALSRIFSVLKGFLIKGLLVLLGAIIIFGLVIGVVEVIVTAASSIIMGQDEDDGKIDLTPYVEIINDLEDEFDAALEILKNNSKYDNVYVSYVTDTMDNTKEMLSMLAVRTNQDLDTSNPLVKQYLKSLYNDSHTYVTKEDEYECSGCETKTVKQDKIDPETGEVEINLETGQPVKEEVEVEYCPGHVDLFIDISILGFDAIFGADTMGNMFEGSAVAGDLIGKATITYYCIEPYPHICNDGTADTTATGTKPTPGRTIAVDPDKIPLGSHVIIDGHEYVAEDTGGAIDSLDIDIVVATHAEALQKGTRKNVPVYWAIREGEGIKDTGEWNGWTKDNIEWCKMIYQQDWSELYTGLGVEGFAPALNDAELQAVLEGLPSNLSETRRNIIQSGLSGIGRIRYNWGGKPTGPGLSGLPATGLDCSGFVTWAYMTAGVPQQDWYGGGTGVINGSSSMTQISHSQLKPGDLGFKHVGGSSSSSNANHVGIYVGKNSSGRDVWLHCASGSGATINTYGGFTVYFRSTAFN